MACSMDHVGNTQRSQRLTEALYGLHFNPQVQIFLDGVQQPREVLRRWISSTAEHPMEALFVEAGLLGQRLERDVSMD